MIEKIQIDYDYLIEYLNTQLNVIGTTTNITLRTVTAHNDANSIYVRKFGVAYATGDITNAVINVPRSDGGMVNRWTFEFYDIATDTLLAKVQDIGAGSVFTDGSALASDRMYIKLQHDQGTVAIQDGDTITLTTDTDPGGLVLYLSGENNDFANQYWYLSSTGSTYYDSEYKYGGYRHTPDSSSKYPYFDITTAIADPDATGFTITTVLDSEIYDEQFANSIAGMILQSALGQTPRIASGIGARVTREVEHDGNNSDTRYVSKTGNDAGAGTYQDPYLTIQFAENNMGGLSWLDIMDSETYEETLTINVDISIEPIYGMTPIITIDSTTVTLIDLAHTGADIYGCIIDGNNISSHLIQMTVNSYVGTVKDNTLYNSVNTGVGSTTNRTGWNPTIKANLIYNIVEHGIYLTTQAAGDTLAGTIEENIIYNAGTTAISIRNEGIAPFDSIDDTTIQNNLIYLCNTDGILQLGNNFNGINKNNTVTLCGRYGLFVNQVVGIAGVFQDNIIYNNTTFDLFHNVGVATTITESNYGTNSGFTIGGGCITSDPRFCKTTSPYKFGLSANSEAIRADTSDDDMGAHFRIIEINESNLEINGFLIDGQEQYNNAVYILDTDNHTGTILKWCSTYDFQGISFDPYDDDTNTDCAVSNCEFYNNGNAIKFSYGGNTVEECLIYNNSIYGIHANRTGDIFNHNVFYNNETALYFESTVSSISLKNSIFHSNSGFGINSEVLITITYCCISDSPMHANVNTSSITNILFNPLFVDLTAGSEDFNIQAIERGDISNSLCKDAADDGYDIGAYLLTREIDELAWKKYVVEVNPNTNNLMWQSKGLKKSNDSSGSGTSWEKDTKMILPLMWVDNNYTTREQWLKIKYFASLRPSRKLGKTKDATRFRVDLEPSNHEDSGLSATVSSVAKTLQDTNKDWVEDEKRGYNVAIIFASGAGMVIDSAAKTGTKAGAGWTIDEHTGRFLKYDGYTYYVKSNTATVLALSDPYSTLVSIASVAYSIEKYFEVEQNDNDTLTLTDDDSELVAGTYNYYIFYVMSRVLNSNFQFKQVGFDPSMDEWKTGYGLTLEQT